MMKVLLLSLLFSITVEAGVSAARKHNESWSQAKSRTSADRGRPFYEDSAFQAARDLSKINFALVYDLKNNEDLMTIFKYVKDTRFIQNFKSPIQRRKLSWMYPDDGCYIRAELMARFIQEKRMPPTKKIFVFGDLAVRSPNAPGGIVRWWYHVAPIYRVGRNVYVLDPAIEPRRPVTIQEWQYRVSVESQVNKFALCNRNTYDPDDNCFTPASLPTDYLLHQQEEFHNYEWERLLQMGRDPYREL